MGGRVLDGNRGMVVRVAKTPWGNAERMRTAHRLSFEVADAFQVIGLDDGYNWQNFRIGTVQGIWSNAHGRYNVLAVQNLAPGNGHMEDFFQWFKHAATRDRMDFVIHEVGSVKLAGMLLRRGFFQIINTTDFKWTPPKA